MIPEMQSEDIEKRTVEDITEILSNWNKTKVDALDKVFPIVYENLKRLAKNARKTIGRTNPDDTYNTLGLVNEIYLRLRNDKSVGFLNRRRFYAYCLLIMSNLLRDYYLKKSSKKIEVPLSDELQTKIEDDSTMQIKSVIDLSIFSDYESKYDTLELAILFDAVLKKLEKIYPDEVEVIFLKYWLDRTDKEIASELSISTSTVRRYERNGRALIRHQIDSTIEPIINKATNITSTTLRGSYLNEICGKDKDFLKDLEIILKEKLKNQKSH